MTAMHVEVTGTDMEQLQPMQMFWSCYVLSSSMCMVCNPWIIAQSRDFGIEIANPGIE
jgi:hypothetical protein